MKVSVVIPTYNSARTIHAAIDSALAQTIAPYEVIVLDDGSTDGTVSILQSYGSSITVLRQENSGVASTRNTLCKKAQGDLIAFLDHDDIWHARYLEIQQKNATKYPDAVAFFTGHTNFYGYESFRVAFITAGRSSSRTYCTRSVSCSLLCETESVRICQLSLCAKGCPLAHPR